MVEKAMRAFALFGNDRDMRVNIESLIPQLHIYPLDTRHINLIRLMALKEGAIA